MKDHVHTLKRKNITVPLRKAIIENGKTVRDIIVGKDILKQLVCECGYTETFDSVRKIF